MVSFSLAPSQGAQDERRHGLPQASSCQTCGKAIPHGCPRCPLTHAPIRERWSRPHPPQPWQNRKEEPLMGLPTSEGL